MSPHARNDLAGDQISAYSGYESEHSKTAIETLGFISEDFIHGVVVGYSG